MLSRSQSGARGHRTTLRGLSRVVAVTQWSCLFVLFALISVSRSYAETSDQLITSGGSGRDVLTVKSEITMTGHGYGRVVTTIGCPAGPSQADRNLTVVFYPSMGATGKSDIATRKNVLLPEGKTSVVVELAIPTSSYMYFDIGVFEDGRDIENQRATTRLKERLKLQQYEFLNTSNSLPPVGFIADSAAESTDYNYLAQANRLSRELAVSRNNTNETLVCSWDSASEDWRTYVGGSTWVISSTALSEIIKKRPAVAEALVTYIGSGGRLFVFDSGPDDAKSATERLFAPSRLSWESASQPSPSWWNTNPVSTVTNTTSGQANVTVRASYGGGGYGGVGYGGGAYGAELVAVEPAKVGPTKAPTSFDGEIDPRGLVYDAAVATETWLAGKFISRLQLLDDTITAIGDDPFYDAPTLPGDSLKAPRAWVAAQLAEKRYIKSTYLAGQVTVSKRSPMTMPTAQFRSILGGSSYSLHSQIAPSTDGDWFYRNLIGAVGKPPVWVFCTVIALFGALIGPGLLYLTARIGRRSLLIFAVPAISFLATTAIIVYGVLHEGFDTHLRVNSVQWIEAGGGRSFAWSRQNYFSGLPPAEGLVFPAQSYLRVVGVDYAGGMTTTPRNRIDGVVTEAEQQVVSGWMRSRTQQQMLVGQSLDKAEFPIRITRQPSGVEVENLGPGRLPLVVFRGAGDDEHYYLEDLAPSEVRGIKPLAESAIMANVARMMADLKPAAPPELQGGGGSLMEFGNQSWRWRSGEESDVINQSYARYMSDKMFLLPYGVSILAEQNDAIAVPLGGKMDKGLHLIVGELKW